MKTCAEDLQSELVVKDKLIHCLQEDLRKVLYDRDHVVNENLEKSALISVLKKQLHDTEQSELRRVGEVTSKDIHIMKLQAELQASEEHKRELQTELQKKSEELQRQRRETHSQPQMQDGLLAELKCQEHTIYQLRTEERRLQAELMQLEAKVEKLQTERDTSHRLYEQAKHELQDNENRIATNTLELPRKATKEEQNIQKLTFSMHGPSTVDNRDGLTVDAAHWHDAFAAIKSDYIDLEKKYFAAVAQVKEKTGTVKQLGMKISNSKTKLEDTNKELEGVRANLVAVLQERDMAKAEVNCKDDLIKKLCQEYKEKRKEHELKVTLVEDELLCMKEEYELSQKQVSKLEKVIMELRKELHQLQVLYAEVVESNGRLEGKIKSCTITAQHEDDVLSNEIFCKEETIHRLKMQLMEHEEKLATSEEKIQHHKKLIELLDQKNSEAADILGKKEELIYSLEQQLREVHTARKDAVLEANECRETINNLHIVLASLKSAENSARNAVIVKEHMSSELTQECAHLKCMLGDAQFKLTSSEQRVNELTFEVGALKSKLQKKSEEAQRLENQIVKHQDALNKANITLKDTKKVAANKIYVRASKHDALQKELVEAQNQYSSCYEELLHREKVVQKLKDENDQLNEQIKQKSQLIGKMTEERRKLELDLAVILEKHKTAQQEVSNRAQVILHLKTDLKTAQEKYFGSQEELGLQEAEVTRLNQKLKCLQIEVRELWDKYSEQEDQLSRIEKENQQFQHEKEIFMEQIESKAKLIEQLQSDLYLTKQSHSTDLERWNQKTSLLQRELDSATAELQENVLKMQEYKKDIGKLKSDLEKSEMLHKEALNKIKQNEDIVAKRNLEVTNLKHSIEGIERKMKECYNQAKASESAVDLFKQKYQAATEANQAMENRAQNLEKEANKSRNEIAEKTEAIHSLEDEIAKLQNHCTEKKDQVDTFEDLIDQLTDELQSTQEDLKNQKEHSLHYNKLVENLSKAVESLQKEISEKEESLLQLRSALTEYQSSHAHSNEEFDAKISQIECVQKELEITRSRCNETTSKVEECQRIVEEQKLEAANVLNQQKQYVHEIEKLEKTLQSLHLDIIASQQKHKVGQAQLEQQIAQLERDLEDARRLCTQKDQATSKRDDLLRKSEADLLQAREGFRVKVSEVEHLDGVVQSLKLNIQDTQKEKAQKEKENMALKGEIQQLTRELQDIHKQYRETAQEVASQDEKLLLMESSLEATQEQLSEQIAETVRQEQGSRKAQTEIRTLRDRVTASEEEISEYKSLLEKLKADLTASKSDQQSKLHEACRVQQSGQKLEVELASARESMKTLQQQVEKYEELGRGLREELRQEQSRHQEQQKQIGQLKQHVTDLEAEVENLRARQRTDAQMLVDREHRALKLEEDLCQIQEKHRCAREEILEVQSQFKLVQMNLSSSEKQMLHHSRQATFYEDAFTNVQHDLEQCKEQCKEYTRNLESAENQIYHLKKELSSLEAKHKEAVDKVHKYEENIMEMKGTLTQSNQQSHGTIQQLTSKEEQLSMLRIERASLQEHLQLCVNEVEQLRNELKISEKKYIDAQNELETLRRALAAARTDSSRLHQESELVVANVNQWIKEQKLENESLAEKAREQNKHMIRFAAEKDHIQEMKDALSKEIKKVKVECEELKIENDQLKVLRSHSANQEALLSQLRGQLEAQEHEQTSLRTEKIAAMEDMHTRLKANIDSIHSLNQQLTSTSNENIHLKQRWENEKRRCQQLDMQLEACNRTISSLQAQLKDKRGQQDTDQLVYPHRGAQASIQNTTSALSMEPERALFNISRACETEIMIQRNSEQNQAQDSADKSYWIGRVAELSAQLQGSTDYYTEKMNQLTEGIQNSRLASPKK